MLFRSFDVMVGDVFLERENIEDVAQSFKLKVVPIIIEGTIQEAVDYVKTKPNSTISVEEKVCEGLVGVPAVRINDFRGNRVIVKIKNKDFTN